MWAAFWRELNFLKNSYWDLSLVTLAPLLVIIFLASMLSQGSPYHLPIVVVDQDHSAYSRQIIRNLQATPALSIYAYEPSMPLAEQHLKQLKAWGVVHIPAQAQANLMHGRSPEIASYVNEAFFSIASTVAGGINSAVSAANREQQQTLIRQLGIPPIDFNLPTIQVTALYNPQLSYELFLEPFAVTAILHLLLACCVATSIGRDFINGSDRKFLNPKTATSIFSLLMGKLLPYIIIFSLWCFLWTVWMSGVQGWTIQGNVLMLLIGQILLFMAYALFATTIVLLAKDINTGLSMVAIYAGSSLSYAGVTLPTIGAPLFTRIWSNSLPFTAYAKLQTQQWIIGSPWQTSLIPLLILVGFVIGFLLLSLLLLKRNPMVSASL
ncbi:ABC transporter permease [Alkanindiges illinoisensis]|uniref:ABC transporter permease n=1 Tax=Alkanindiges illinoisensis TaxID=197183 RepID=UPI00047C165E|nr:ABC transporter permease [Alkanindiges illinoisensis]